MIARHIGKEPPVIGVPPWLGFGASWIIGRIMRDEFVTWPEIEGLMANTLHVPGATPTGTTRLSDWVSDHSATLGIRYHSELGRRRERSRVYEK